MGADIHMSILKSDGSCAYKEIYDGRNYEWFDNISGQGNQVYEYYPIQYGLPELENLPQWYKDDYDKQKENCYYSFCYISVMDFLAWFNKYKPHIDAGWVSTYDKWLYENKGIIPENYDYTLTSDRHIIDMHFMEFENPYDSSLWLVNFIKEHNVDECAYIVYYFDH